MVGTRNADEIRVLRDEAEPLPASKRGWITVVRPDCNAPSRPSDPPTWKIGTHIMPTMGGSSGSNGAVIIDSKRWESVRWLIGIALGSPVVPLVNSTSASSSPFSTVSMCSESPAARSVGPEYDAVDSLLERVTVRLAGHTDGATPGGANELADLGRLQLHVHQRGRRPEPRGAEDHHGRRQTSDVDDGDPITGSDTTVGEYGRAPRHRRRDIGVRELVVADDRARYAKDRPRRRRRGPREMFNAAATRTQVRNNLLSHWSRNWSASCIHVPGARIVGAISWVSRPSNRS